MKNAVMASAAFVAYVAWRMDAGAAMVLALTLGIAWALFLALREPAPRGRVLNQARPRPFLPGRLVVGVGTHLGPFFVGLYRRIGR